MGLARFRRDDAGTEETMIPDWETDGVYFSRLLAKRDRTLYGRLTKVLTDHGVQVRLLEGTRDVWARDYCPVQVTKSSFVKVLGRHHLTR